MPTSKSSTTVKDPTSLNIIDTGSLHQDAISVPQENSVGGENDDANHQHKMHCEEAETQHEQLPPQHNDEEAQKQTQTIADVVCTSTNTKQRHAQKRTRESTFLEFIRLHQNATEEEKAVQLEVEELERRIVAARSRLEIARSRTKEAFEAFIDTELKGDDEWHLMYQKLVEYKERNGNVHFPLDFDVNNPELKSLNDWVREQRRGSPGNLSWCKRAALDRLGFVWDTYEATWKERYNELLEYRKEHGHFTIPDVYEPRPKLMNWAKTQRKEYKKRKEGEKTRLSQERIELLEKVGFSWGHASWHVRYQEFLAHKNEHNTVNIPKVGPHSTLGCWVSTQRKNYRLFQEGKPSPLTEERIQLLNDAGFIWKAYVDWEHRYKELLSYRAESGTCAWFCRYKEKYPTLARWMRRQREQYKLFLRGEKSRIKPEQVKLLDDIGFIWNLRKEDEL